MLTGVNELPSVTEFAIIVALDEMTLAVKTSTLSRLPVYVGKYAATFALP
jgi:hypothetical protein